MGGGLGGGGHLGHGAADFERACHLEVLRFEVDGGVCGFAGGSGGQERCLVDMGADALAGLDGAGGDFGYCLRHFSGFLGFDEVGDAVEVSKPGILKGLGVLQQVIIAIATRVLR